MIQSSGRSQVGAKAAFHSPLGLIQVHVMLMRPRARLRMGVGVMMVRMMRKVIASAFIVLSISEPAVVVVCLVLLPLLPCHLLVVPPLPSLLLEILGVAGGFALAQTCMPNELFLHQVVVLGEIQAICFSKRVVHSPFAM